MRNHSLKRSKYESELHEKEALCVRQCCESYENTMRHCIWRPWEAQNTKVQSVRMHNLWDNFSFSQWHFIFNAVLKYESGGRKTVQERSESYESGRLARSPGMLSSRPALWTSSPSPSRHRRHHLYRHRNFFMKQYFVPLCVKKLSAVPPLQRITLGGVDFENQQERRSSYCLLGVGDPLSYTHSFISFFSIWLHTSLTYTHFKNVINPKLDSKLFTCIVAVIVTAVLHVVVPLITISLQYMCIILTLDLFCLSWKLQTRRVKV